MNQPHHTRDHAAWSASASDRRWACAGSLALEAGAADVEGEAAAWGTACHEVCERALTSGHDAVHYLGETIKTKAHSFEVDDEMAECAQVFIDYVRGQMRERQTVLVEHKFSLDAIDPPIAGGGTADAVIIDPAGDLIEVIDLKTGRGVVVEATENKQLRTYALGVFLSLKPSVSRIRVTIVQPRAPHPDGRIRSETFSVIDLMDWTEDLLQAMGRAEVAMQYHKAGSPAFAGSLTAGSHCQFCKASATCPTLRTKALAEAKTFFKPETGEMSVPPAPEELQVDQIVRILDHADMIGNWLNAVRAHAQRMAEAGLDVTDGNSTYVLTAKRAMRKWRDKIAAEDAVADELDTVGLTPLDIVTSIANETKRPVEDFFHPPEPLSPAQTEKLLGKKAYALAAEKFVTKESSGFNLTRADKTTRAVEAPAKTFFQPET